MPCSTLGSVDVQCSIAILLILYIVMSFGITLLTIFFASGFVKIRLAKERPKELYVIFTREAMTLSRFFQHSFQQQ